MTTVNENSLRKILAKVTYVKHLRTREDVYKVFYVFLVMCFCVCTQIYKYRDLTSRDLTVTSHYKDLKPVLDNYGKSHCGSNLQTHL